MLGRCSGPSSFRASLGVWASRSARWRAAAGVRQGSTNENARLLLSFPTRRAPARPRGALLGAGASYGVGAYLGHAVLVRLAGPRINLLSQSLARRGLTAVILVRLVPVAPFAVVNMVAGASHIRLRDLVLGTAIGITPGTLAMMLFMDQITAALRAPSTGTVVLLGVTVLLLAAGAWALRCWLRKVDR